MGHCDEMFNGNMLSPFRGSEGIRFIVVSV